jgi:hypothetical protein
MQVSYGLRDESPSYNVANAFTLLLLCQAAPLAIEATIAIATTGPMHLRQGRKSFTNPPAGPLRRRPELRQSALC